MRNSVSCKNNPNWLAQTLESLRCVGYALVSDVMSEAEVREAINGLQHIRPLIQSEVGLERLKRANEEGVFRLPMKFDPFFLKLLQIPEVLEIVDNTVSSTANLHLQNGFIFPAHKSNQTPEIFQYTFHPDFPRVLNGYMASVNILFTFTELTEECEGFYVVPGSHQKPYVLDQEYCKANAVPIVCPAGSILVFDSTTWHCGGPNYSEHDWYGMNHQFTRSYIKQQIDYVRALGEDIVLSQPPRTQQLLGWYTRVVTSLDEYYRPEAERLYRKGQG